MAAPDTPYTNTRNTNTGKRDHRRKGSHLRRTGTPSATNMWDKCDCRKKRVASRQFSVTHTTTEEMKSSQALAQCTTRIKTLIQQTHLECEPPSRRNKHYETAMRTRHRTTMHLEKTARHQHGLNRRKRQDSGKP